MKLRWLKWQNSNLEDWNKKWWNPLQKKWPIAAFLLKWQNSNLEDWNEKWWNPLQKKQPIAAF